MAQLSLRLANVRRRVGLISAGFSPQVPELECRFGDTSTCARCIESASQLALAQWLTTATGDDALVDSTAVTGLVGIAVMLQLSDIWRYDPSYLTRGRRNG